MFTVTQASLSQRGKILTDPFNHYYWSISHKGINHTFSDIGAIFERWSLTVSCRNIIYSMICQSQPSHPSLHRGFKAVSLYGFMCLRLSGRDCVCTFLKRHFAQALGHSLFNLFISCPTGVSILQYFTKKLQLTKAICHTEKMGGGD